MACEKPDYDKIDLSSFGRWASTEELMKQYGKIDDEKPDCGRCKRYFQTDNCILQNIKEILQGNKRRGGKGNV